MTISQWLTYASNELLSAGFDNSVLDSEVILAHTIGHPRTWLHAHAEETIDLRHEEIANARLDLRFDHVPVAYIIGHKEFYGRRFAVTPQVLVPRPESETLIEILNETIPSTKALDGIVPKRLVDIGTGSGCLGITAKLQHPELAVTLLDTSQAALKVATRNAQALEADVEILRSDLLLDYPYQPDIILANLPYVDVSWRRSEETNHEPEEALFAAEDGLSLIIKCIDQASTRMSSGGLMILEADPRQWQQISELAKSADFECTRQEQFGVLYRKR